MTSEKAKATPGSKRTQLSLKTEACTSPSRPELFDNVLVYRLTNRYLKDAFKKLQGSRPRMTSCAPYLRALLESRESLLCVVRLVTKLIKDSGVQYDSIAFRGMSGALLCPILSLRLRKKMIMVRKGEKTHSGFKVEGVTEGSRYIIVDDLIVTGRTIDAIISSLPESECVGIFLWQE